MELDKIWKKSAMMGVLVSIACQVALIVAYMLLTTQFPKLHERLLPLPDLLLLGVAHVALSVWLVCAHYTRGFRREPYVLLTIATAVVFLAAGYTAAAWIGTTGVTLAFSIVNCVAALVAIPILLNFRKTYAR